MDLVPACDDLFPLPVEENAASWTWCALAITFSPCLSRERSPHGLGVCLRWAFPPACRGKGCLMDLVCACDGLFLLPVEEKAVSWTWRALAMSFSPCLSRRRPSPGLCARLRWPFPPACRGKGRIMDLVCACDAFFLSACRGKVRFRSPRRPPREASRGPRKWPGSSRAKKLSILTIFAS